MNDAPAWLLTRLIPYLWPHYHPSNVCKAWAAMASIKTRFWIGWAREMPEYWVGGTISHGGVIYHPSMHPDLKCLLRMRQEECFRGWITCDKYSHIHPRLGPLWSFDQVMAFIDEMFDPHRHSWTMYVRGIEAARIVTPRKFLEVRPYNMSPESAVRWCGGKF